MLPETDPPADNLLVRGDNLAALERLRGALAGRVQCVYIDPPYNTGAEPPDYRDGAGDAGWLAMMRPRLALLRELLAPEGSIFVHLDGVEIDRLALLMDELFGRANLVNRITVAARSPSAFSTVNRGVFKAAEYLLWFARDRERMREYRVRVPRRPDPAYDRWLDNPDDDHSAWRLTTLREAAARAGVAAELDRFVVANARHVFRLAAISDTRAGRPTVEAKHRSLERPDEVLRVEREGLAPHFILRGQQMVFYDRNVARIDGRLTATAPLTDVWTDVAWEGIAGEGGVRFKKGKKPERLLKRCLELTTRPGDLVLDAFAGSGTTGAVAHKMRRRWVMIEEGPQCETHILPRLSRVVAGEDRSGITRAVGWTGGGGFAFEEWGQTPSRSSMGSDSIAEFKGV